MQTLKVRKRNFAVDKRFVAVFRHLPEARIELQRFTFDLDLGGIDYLKRELNITNNVLTKKDKVVLSRYLLKKVNALGIVSNAPIKINEVLEKIEFSAAILVMKRDMKIYNPEGYMRKRLRDYDISLPVA